MLESKGLSWAAGKLGEGANIIMTKSMLEDSHLQGQEVVSPQLWARSTSHKNIKPEKIERVESPITLPINQILLHLKLI